MEIDRFKSTMKNYQIYDSTSKPADIWNHVSKPRLVLSIIGDSCAFVPRVWHHMLFKTAVIDTAKRAGGCLVFYSGIDFGLGRLVGEMIRDYDMRRSKLQTDECKEKAREDGIQLVAMTQDTEDNNNVAFEKQTLLDKNAHHYVFIKHQDANDELVRLKYTDTLVKIEKYINGQKVPFFETEEKERVFEMRIPVVIVVAEGDLNTIEHVALAVEQDLPVIIIQGSGKAADLLAECIVNEESLVMKGPALIGIYFDRNEFEKLQNLIERIKKKRWLINVFNLHVDTPCKMSEIVGDSVLRAWSMEYTQGPAVPIPEQPISNLPISAFRRGSTLKALTKFIYPMARKRASPITEAELETVSDPKFRPTSKLHFHLIFQLLQETGRLQSKNAERLLFEAIKENRLDFVEILLQHGVKFRHEKFWDLYTKTIKCQSHNQTNNCRHIHGILMDVNIITPRLFAPLREKDSKKKGNLCPVQAARTICQDLLKYSHAKSNNNGDAESRTDDLLLWSLFANNKEMAEIFWQRCTYPILTALISSAVLDHLAVRADRLKQDVLSEKFRNHARIFEGRAMDLLDKLFEQNEDRAIRILTQNVVVWGINANPMGFSYQYYRMDFLAHRCCQMTLDRKWYRGLASNFSSFITFRCGKETTEDLDEHEIHAEKLGKKITNFIRAPITKFLVNYIIFFVFLILFSIYLINGVAHTTMRSEVLEWMITLWIAGDFFEELLGVVYREKGKKSASTHSLLFHVRRWLYDFWNSMDLLCYTVYIAAFISKRLEDTAPYLITRRLYTLCLFLVYMRFLYAFLVLKMLGPYIIMIKQMLQDLWKFMFILAVFIAAIGVGYHANRFPNRQHFFGDGMKHWTLYQITSMPFWQLFGETFIEELENDVLDPVKCGNITDNDIYDCPKYDPIILLMSALYMLFSNLLLVNVIIAMFSFRFEKVQSDSKRLWKYYRYSVVKEYETKIPTPLNLLIRPFIHLRILYFRFRSCSPKSQKFNMMTDEKEIQHWQGVNAAICRQESIYSHVSESS